MAAVESAVTLRGDGGTFFGAAAAAASAAAPDAEAVLAYRSGAAPRRGKPRSRALRRVRRHASAVEDDIGNARGDQAREGREDCEEREEGSGGGGGADADAGAGADEPDSRSAWPRGEQAEVQNCKGEGPHNHFYDIARVSVSRPSFSWADPVMWPCYFSPNFK